MAAIGLLAAGVLLVILLAVLGSWVVIVSRRSIAHHGVTEQQAWQNAAPLTTAILSPRTRERSNRSRVAAVRSAGDGRATASLEASARSCASSLANSSHHHDA